MARKSFPNSGSEAVAQAGALIRAGKLVAFPTETVYGLGANALDAAAVERIFEAKGRPHTSPLIVHVPTIAMARSLVRSWPDEAQRLAERYWPGPLTLVLPKQPAVPGVVTAGLDTVGLRIPAHPVALALLVAAGVPIAAPSANRFTELSPTTAEHVEKALGEAADMILDGGPTTVGIESTVLSLANEHPMLLRAGMVSQVEIETLIGPVTAAGRVEDTAAHASPGMHKKHYSPRTPLVVVENGTLPASGRGAYLWIRQRAPAEKPVEMPGDAARYAAILYETLHQLDAEGWDWIAVEKPPEGAAWAGVADRIGRAGKRA